MMLNDGWSFEIPGPDLDGFIETDAHFPAGSGGPRSARVEHAVATQRHVKAAKHSSPA